MEESLESILRGGEFKKLIEMEIADLREKYGLKKIEIEMIYFLSYCGDKDTAVNIQENLKANKGYISQAAFHLSERGFVEALQDKTDRRCIHYSLTNEGYEVAENVAEIWNKIRRELFEGVSDEDMECCKKVFDTARRNMKKILGSRAVGNRS